MPNYKLQVEVTPQYLPEQSDPAGDLYTFAYSITITNTGNIAAQVISRSWSVNDANGLHEKSKVWAWWGISLCCNRVRNFSTPAERA